MAFLFVISTVYGGNGIKLNRTMFLQDRDAAYNTESQKVHVCSIKQDYYWATEANRHQYQ